MPAPSKFTEAWLIDWTRKKLGDPTVCVELDETQIMQCIDDTMELFQKYQPRIYIQPYDAARGYHRIEQPNDITIGVVDVEFVRVDYSNYESIEGALLYDPFYFLSAGGISGIDVQTYDMIRHWTEIISREFGAEEGYMLLDDGRIFIQCPGWMKVNIHWTQTYTGLCDVRRPYYLLFQKLVLAKSRQILGHIRGKFAGVPGAGGTVQLDGEYQRDKGAMDEERLTDELMRTSLHYLPSMA